MARRNPARPVPPLVLSALLPLLVAPASLPMFAASQEPPSEGPYPAVVEKLKNMGLEQERAYDLLRRLTSVGPRLTGSDGAAAGVELMRVMMTELGFENVRLEPVTVERWVRGGADRASIVDPPLGGSGDLAISALGGSVGTPAGGITAPLVEVRSFEELGRLGAAVKGSIVLFNRPMDRTLVETFKAYGGAADQRIRGASEAAKLGAAAVLVRSLTLREDSNPHTGILHYEPGVLKIPAAAIATKDATFLSGLLGKGTTVRVRLELACKSLGPASSANVIGELRGTELSDEVILLGGHVDSWDLATGAHDDGAGCVASVEALRLIKACGLRPKRTIRAVMFMDEEFGGTGGRFYAVAPGREGEKHIAAMESDGGGSLPIGVAGGPPDVYARLKKWTFLFEPLGIRWMRPGGGGVDVAPLAAAGTVLLGIIVDSQRYFDVHHSALDVLPAVHPRELELLSIALAAYAYILAQEGV
jgi:carboxypeptidase Q